VYPEFILHSVELGVHPVELGVHSVELGVDSVELGVYSMNSEYYQLNSEYNWLNSEHNLDLYWDILWDKCRVEGPGGRIRRNKKWANFLQNFNFFVCRDQ
jgi:hypothetical protein